MPTLREAAQAVMTCWDAPEWGAAPPSLTGDLMDALRAQLEQPEQEPVAWMHTTATGHVYFRKKPQDAVFNPQPLFAHPPSKQMTDEQIDEMWSDVHNDTSTLSLVKVFARAIEQAHGIKEKP